MIPIRNNPLLRTPLLTCAGLFLTVLLGTYLAYQPHVENPLPLLADEYVHIALAQQLVNEHILPFNNPYIATPTWHTNFQLGFHLFVAALIVIIPGDIVHSLQYLPSLILIVNSLLLFRLVRVVSNLREVALLAVFFYVTIPSADGLLAHQYFVPLILGTTLLFTSYLFFYQWLKTRKRRFVSGLTLTLLAAAFTYPPALFLFLVTVFIYSLLQYRTFTDLLHIRPRTFFVVSSILLSLGAGLSTFTLWQLDLLPDVFFGADWAPSEVLYSPFFYFGLIPSSLALIGISYITWRKNRSDVLFVIWFCYCLAALYVYYLVSYSAFIPFPRLFYFYLISISVLAGYGTYYFNARALRSPHRILPYITVSGTALMLTLHLWLTTSTGTALPTIITPEAYTALQHAAKAYSPSLIITDPLTAVAVYPATGAKVLSVLNSNLGGGNSRATRMFLEAPCAEKRTIFSTLTPYLQNKQVQEAPFMVMSHSPQNCDFLHIVQISLPHLYLYQSAGYTVADFQHANGLTLIPTPLPIEQTTLPNHLSDEAALQSLFAGNTSMNESWSEYYRPNGRLTGRAKEPYNGVWAIQSGQFCYYIYENSTSGCRLVAVEHDVVTFYYPDGRTSSQATILPGNQLH